MAVVLVLIDALRHDYLTETNMPFLYKFAKDNIYVEKIKPSFSFCERTEIFTGMYPVKSNNFTALGYDPESSEYRKFKIPLAIIDKIPLGSTFGKIIRRLIGKISSVLGIKMGMYYIPLSMLSKLSLTEDAKSHYEKFAFTHESIFDLLDVKSAKVYTKTFTHIGSKDSLNDNERVEHIIKSAGETYDLRLLYIGGIDELGHKFKFNSEIIINKLNEIDGNIKKIWEKYSKVDPSFSFVVLGDHGMSEVKHKVNIYNSCDELTYKLGRDYQLFIDSTMVRFWFKDKNVEKCFYEHFIAEQSKGKYFVLTKEKAKQLNVPTEAKCISGEYLYGDLILCACEGTIFKPDYFHLDEEIVGMHGYPTHNDGSYGLLVTNYRNRNSQIREGELVDVCPTLCKLLDIKEPNGNNGRSFV
jgi:hypothetical protein